MNRAFPGWHYAPVSEEVRQFSQEQHFDPVVAMGDYDGDGRRDWAVLLEHEGVRKVVVCLTNSTVPKLRVIEQPYCHDLVSSKKAKSRLYNFETDRIETIKNDGISTSCFERAGATYVFERGTIRRIIDDD